LRLEAASRDELPGRDASRRLDLPAAGFTVDSHAVNAVNALVSFKFALLGSFFSLGSGQFNASSMA